MKSLSLITLCALALPLTSAFAERNYLAWQQRAGTDIGSTYRAVATTVTSRGHVAVAGYNDLLQNDTWQVVSYDSLTGNVRWSKSKSSAFGDVRPAAILEDHVGDVYVGGFTTGNGHDFLVIKYDANDGTEKWSKTYNNGASNGSDEITAMGMDGYGNLTVTGGSYNNGNEDFYTIQYDYITGAVNWEKRYSTSYQDRPAALAVGPNGSLAIVGKSRIFDLSCYTTIRYDSAGAQQAPLNYDTVNDDVPSDVAFDSAGSIYVTGTVRIASKYVVHTVKYGTNPWVKTYDAPGENSDWAPKVSVAKDGNPVMACTARLDGKRVVYRAAKYNASTGAELWEEDTALLTGRPTDDMTDTLADMVVDSLGDVVVTGSTLVPSAGTDYLTVKFSGIDGRIIWKQQLNGDSTSGSDTAAALALSRGGDVIVTGLMDRGNQNTYYHKGTVRYNRMALSKGDRVIGSGLTAAAVVNSLGSPAVTGYGDIVTKLTVKDGSKIFNGILHSQTGNRVEVMQGQAAPGVPNAKFATFTDPVPGTVGYSFVATLSGAPTGQTSGLWTMGLNANAPTLVLQSGKQAPALPSGVLVASIVNFAPIYDGIVALVTLKGTGVTTANNSALLQCNGATNKLVMRTGTSLTLDGKTSTVKTIGIFSPPVGSAGHGRYVSFEKQTMKLTLADARTVITTVNTTNMTSRHHAVSGGSADTAVAGAKWTSFTQPGMASNGESHTVLGTLKTGIGGVTTANDSIIVIADNTNDNFTTLAREGSAAKHVPNANYATLGVPISGSYGWYAFQGTIKGTGITAANNSGIWVGGSAASYFLLARTGSLAPDAWGADTSRQYATFQSIAIDYLPKFRATLKGPGVTAANNNALFGMDYDSSLRQLLRTGDKMGSLTIKSFSLLNAAPKAMSASRSFNPYGTMTALVTFTNLTQSIVRIDVP